jgi:ankyrin repeat protein
MTPLHHAAMNGNARAAKRLIRAGANVNARLDSLRRAYGRAQFTGASGVTNRLERAGALKTFHEDAESVLDMASTPEVAKILRQARAKRAREIDPRYESKFERRIRRILGTSP